MHRECSQLPVLKLMTNASTHWICDRLLETNGSFRQARMRRECGPITDPQLRQSCIDSFTQYEPAAAHATVAASLTALAALPANAATSSAAGRQNVIQSERYDPLCRLVEGTAAASRTTTVRRGLDAIRGKRPTCGATSIAIAVTPASTAMPGPGHTLGLSLCRSGR
jgi:hypothetical protein